MTSDNPSQPPFSQQFQHTPVAARVPEKISGGVFSTGSLVQTLGNEFVIDFIQNLSRPAAVVARVIVSPEGLKQMTQTVEKNFEMYREKFGTPPAIPKPINPRQPTIQEIYDELKLPDELMGGCYSNTLMVGHSPSEFVLDFITNFYPKAAVGSRVFVSAPQIPRLLDTWRQAMRNFQSRKNSPPPPPMEGGPPPGPQEPPLSHPPV